MGLPATLASDDYYLRLPEVKSRSGLCKSTIYKLVRAGQFPAPRKLGGAAVGWRASELHTGAIVARGPANRSPHNPPQRRTAPGWIPTPLKVWN